MVTSSDSENASTEAGETAERVVIIDKFDIEQAGITELAEIQFDLTLVEFKGFANYRSKYALEEEPGKSMRLPGSFCV